MAPRSKARVLLDCSWGAADDVVTLARTRADAGVAAGELDTNAEAVAYAKAWAPPNPTTRER